MELVETVMSPTQVPQLVPSQVVVPSEHTTDVPDLISTFPHGAVAPDWVHPHPGAGWPQLPEGGGPPGVFVMLVRSPDPVEQPGTSRVPATRRTVIATNRNAARTIVREEKCIG